MNHLLMKSLETRTTYHAFVSFLPIVLTFLRSLTLETGSCSANNAEQSPSRALDKHTEYIRNEHYNLSNLLDLGFCL